MRQPHEMVRHTQTICLQIAGELFDWVLPFWGVGAERVKINWFDSIWFEFDSGDFRKIN